MKTFSRIFKTVIAIGLLAASSASFAIPTLNFGANLNYDTTGSFPADLNITGVVNGFQDLSLTPDLATSSFSLFADFISESSTASTTTGTFGTASIGNDLLIMDGSGTSTRTLLTGTVNGMLFTGPNGFNLGNLTGAVTITGGLLAVEYGGLGALVAFNFNLDTNFGAGMFGSNFTGLSNGSIEGTPVPEPMPLALLSLGLIGITLTRKVCKR